MSGIFLITVDFGNSRLKFTLMRDDRCVEAYVGNYEEVLSGIENWVADYGKCNAVISGSGPIRDDVIEQLNKRGVEKVLIITAHTPVPIEVDYPRESLGLDRLAAAVGAAADGKTILIVDVGTAITQDLICGCRYEGGNISPGLSMRFKSLNENCIHLPLAEPSADTPLIGKNTREAISSGVTRGFIHEIAGHYSDVRSKYGDVELVLTGGDARIVGKCLTKAGIPYRIDGNLVARGMCRIYEYNDNNN